MDISFEIHPVRLSLKALYLYRIELISCRRHEPSLKLFRISRKAYLSVRIVFFYDLRNGKSRIYMTCRTSACK